jgi:hypothetical protein
MPGSLNYFYNLYARWMAEAFRGMGLKVDLHVLDEVPQADYDFCILSNIGEIEWANRGLDPRTRLMAIRRRCRTLISFSADCAQTTWFQNNLAVARELGADAILDVGFVAQEVPELRQDGPRYHFAFDGLLETQASALGAVADEDLAGRTIPWTHIGGRNPKRVELTERLITRLSPQGFIYLPEPGPVTETGSPHLNSEQMERILRRTRYYVWFSKHRSFFMESLRFRMAWLSGCVPVEVVDDSADLPENLPFSDWVMREGEVAERLRTFRFRESRRAFREEYLRRPKLEDGLASLVRKFGYLASGGANWTSLYSCAGQALGSCA